MRASWVRVYRAPRDRGVANPAQRVLDMEWQMVEWLHYDVHSGTLPLEFVLHELNEAGAVVDVVKLEELVHTRLMDSDFRLSSARARDVVVAYTELCTPTKPQAASGRKGVAKDGPPSLLLDSDTAAGKERNSNK